MSNDAQVNLLLAIRADLQQLKDARREFGGLKDDVKEGQGVFSSFAGTLKGGFGLNLGAQIAQNLRESIGSIKDFINEGVRFNGVLESASFSLAGVLRQFRPDSFKTMAVAISASADVISRLKKEALLTKATFEELLVGYQGAAGAMFAAGVPLQKQVTLISNISQAMSALGIKNEELRQEATALLSGNIDRNARLAQTLGITRQQIEAAREQGNIYEFVTEKLEAFSEMAVEAANTQQVLESNLKDTVTQIAAESTVNLASSYKDLLKALIELTKDDSFKAVTKFLADSAATAVGAAAAVISNGDGIVGFDKEASAVEKMTELLSSVDSEAGVQKLKTDVSTALASLRAELDKSESQLKQLDDPGLFGIFQMDEAGKAETINDKRIQKIQLLIEKYEQLAAAIDADAAKSAAENAAANALTREKEEQARLDEMAAKENEKLAKELPKELAENEKYTLANLTTLEKLVHVREKLANARDRAADELPKEFQGKGLEAEKLKRQNEVLKLKHEESVLEDKLIAQADEEAQNAKKTLNDEEKRVSNARVRLEVERSRAEVDVARAAISIVENDATKTQIEKKAQILDLLKVEHAALLANIAALEAEKKLAQDPNVKQSIQQKIDSQKSRLPQLQAEGFKNRPTTFTEDLKGGLASLRDGFATVGSTIATTIGGAIRTISSGITGLITGTLTWGQALASIGTSILTSVIQAIVEMSVQWVARRLIEFALGNTLRAAALAANLASASASLAMWAPAATAVSIATLGAADAIGVAAYHSAIASSLATGGYYSGGYTGDGDPTDPAGTVHKKEYVIPHQATARLGRPFLDSLVQGKVQPSYLAGNRIASAGGGSGGGSSGGGGSMPAVNQHFAFFDEKEKMESWLRSRSGSKTIIDVVAKAGFRTR